MPEVSAVDLASPWSGSRVKTLFFGGSEVRVTWPAAALRAKGWQVEHFTEVGAAIDYRPDLAVIHWPLQLHKAEVFAALRSFGTLVVASEDDDVDTIPPMHYLREDKSYSGWVWNWREAWRHTDAAVVTTDTLAAAVRRRFDGPIFVTPNYLPRKIAPRPSGDHTTYPRSVLWHGTARWHWEDLLWLRPVVSEIERDGWHLHLIGDPATARLLRTGVTLSEGMVEVTELYRSLGRFDIGIVPLVDDPFTRAKSWLKGLEYAHAGLPVVARRLPEYEALHRALDPDGRWDSGPLHLVDTPLHLVDTPEQMVRSVTYFQRMGERYRLRLGKQMAEAARRLYLEDNLGPWEAVLSWAESRTGSRATISP